MRRIVPVQNAVGMVLCHDITEVVPGRFKGRAFRKGHVVTMDDIPRLLNLGKENLYALSLEPGVAHEDDAARRIAQAAAGPGVTVGEPSEGRVNLSAQTNGLLKINVEALNRINLIQDVVLGTLHTNRQVDVGRTIASTRIIPLVTEEARIRSVERICRECSPMVSIKTFRALKVGIGTTGSEVFNGRIQDGFGPVLRCKFAQLGCSVLDQILVSDEIEMTARAISDLVRRGAEMIAVTGGMSVDPDDQTPTAIRAAGAEVVAYGAASFPGAMFLLAMLEDLPIVGLPACVMYYGASIFDLIVPRIVAGETVTREEIAALGHGGLCASCSECRYPDCSFGKGA